MYQLFFFGEGGSGFFGRGVKKYIRIIIFLLIVFFLLPFKFFYNSVLLCCQTLRQFRKLDWKDREVGLDKMRGFAHSGM